MPRKRYIFLYLLGLVVASLAAWLQPFTGYMDADYYLLGGEQLAAGKGFTDPILWNYLDDPETLPHPSHGYWMPLASILAALSLRLAPFRGLTGARIIFLLLTACLPPLTASLTWHLTPERSTRSRRNMATLAGLLAAFPGFYLSFLTVPDAFGLYMVFGAVFLGLINLEGPWAKWLGLGLLAGLMHLARADGFLWLGVAGVAVILEYGIRNMQYILRVAYSVFGYLLVMGPWMLRNLMAFGTPLAPGGVRALWVLNYEELFTYPASGLTFQRWWASGWGEILWARFYALGQNLQTLLGVQGAVFLLPLILLGLWPLRRKRVVQVGVFAWGVTLGVMTLVFPFSGARGGFFHSGAAVQPLFWAVAPVGLEAFVAWGGRTRGWRVAQAQRVFGAGLVGLALLFTAFTFIPHMSQKNNSGDVEVEAKLVEWGAKPNEVVMVNNPPGYYLASGRPAVVMPYGDLRTWSLVIEKYGVTFVVVDENAPEEVHDLLAQAVVSNVFQLMGQVGTYQVFQVLQGGDE